MSEVNNTNFQGILWGSKNSAEDIDALKKAANDGTISKDEFTSIFGEDNYNELLESTNMKDSTEEEISDALLIAMQNLDDNEYDADEDDEYSTSLASIEERTGAKDLDLNDFEKITEYINGNVNEDSAEELTVQSLIKDATKLNDYEWQKETLKKAGIDIDNGWVRRPTEEEMANWTEEQKNNVSYYYNNPETRECVKALLNGDGSTLIVHTTIEKGTAVGKTEIYKQNEKDEPKPVVHRPVHRPDPEPEPTPEPDPTPTPDPEPEPTPEPDPTPTPDPEPEPTPEPDPTPTPDPEPEPTPEPDPTPTPDPEPEPTPEPDPTPTPDPEPDLPPIGGGEEADPVEPEPTPEPDPTPTPDPEPEPTPEPDPEPTPEPEPEPTPPAEPETPPIGSGEEADPVDPSDDGIGDTPPVEDVPQEPEPTPEPEPEPTPEPEPEPTPPADDNVDCDSPFDGDTPEGEDRREELFP